MKATIIVRWIICVALVYGVFTETGIFTAITIALIFIANELPEPKK